MALITDLLGYWKLDVDSSTQVDSENSNDGTVTSATYTASGKLSGAYDFNGSSGSIELTFAANFPSTFSLSFWANPTTDGEGDQGRAFEIERGNGYNTVAICTAGNSSYTDAWRGFSATSGTDANSYENNTVDYDTWQHIVLTYDDSGDRKIKIYKNGTELTYDAQVASTGTLEAPTDAAWIGNRSFDDRTFDGIIDEVGVWSRVLSGAEITELYNSGDGLAYPFGGGAVVNNALLYGTNQ